MLVYTRRRSTTRKITTPEFHTWALLDATPDRSGYEAQQPLLTSERTGLESSPIHMSLAWRRTRRRQKLRPRVARVTNLQGWKAGDIPCGRQGPLPLPLVIEPPNYDGPHVPVIVIMTSDNRTYVSHNLKGLLSSEHDPITGVCNITTVYSKYH
jgi:hypothetical protein